MNTIERLSVALAGLGGGTLVGYLLSTRPLTVPEWAVEPMRQFRVEIPKLAETRFLDPTKWYCKVLRRVDGKLRVYPDGAQHVFYGVWMGLEDHYTLESCDEDWMDIIISATAYSPPGVPFDAQIESSITCKGGSRKIVYFGGEVKLDFPGWPETGPATMEFVTPYRLTL